LTSFLSSINKTITAPTSGIQVMMLKLLFE